MRIRPVTLSLIDVCFADPSDNLRFDEQLLAASAGVLRLWIDACTPEPPDVRDLIRFNEAIDQALAESIDYFTHEVERARNGVTIDELASLCRVTTRTIRRDLQALEEAGFPLYDDRSGVAPLTMVENWSERTRGP